MAQPDPPDGMASRNSSELPEAPYLRRKEREKRRVGRAIREYTDPFALEVHRSIDIPQTHLRVTLPALTAYAPRDHDRKLRRIVDEANAGTSRIAMLVGGSSTGKTRACWEAVQLLPGNWRLWHPIDPSRPEAALAGLRWVRPYTVIWLNEVQYYLLTSTSDLGERIAAGLRELLREPRRAPVLVLGTIWPEYWARVATTPPPGEPDPHAQARALCEGNELPVPSSFAGGELAVVRETSESDPRLASAVQYAQHGQITQYLAGGPALLRRYWTAPDGARALIESAMDARRLGHGRILPHSLLAAAAEGYLSEQQWDLLPSDWLEQSLAYCTAPCGGTPGPLVRVRLRATEPSPAEPAYRLADYLEQHGRRTRRTTRAPNALWNALIEHGRPVDLTTIAQAAQTRGFLETAMRLYANAVHAGDNTALHMGARLLRKAERYEAAISWYQRAAEAGTSSALRQATELMELIGQGEEAINWLRARAEAGDLKALPQAAEALERAGREEEAVDYYQTAAENGDNHALWHAVDLLERAGRTEEAISWLRIRAGYEDSPAALRLEEMLEKSGRSDEAIARLQARAETGDVNALWRAANLMEHAGRSDEAIAWLRSRAQAGQAGALRLAERLTGGTARSTRSERDTDTHRSAPRSAHSDAIRETAEAMESAGRIAEAVSWYRRLAEVHDSAALRRTIAELLQRDGQPDQAITWYQRAVQKGDVHAISQAADLMQSTGCRDEALTWLGGFSLTDDARVLRQAAQALEKLGQHDEAVSLLLAGPGAKDGSVLLHAAEILERHGRLTEAATAYRQAAEAGNIYALRHTAALLENTGRSDEALTWLWERIEAGDIRAVRPGVSILLKAGRVDEAIVWYQLSAEVGDTHALWRVGNLLEQTARKDERTKLWRYGWSPDGTIMDPWEAPAL
ncbi:tetratricopeptide repeat protein [Streptomyces sp. NPDC001107]